MSSDLGTLHLPNPLPPDIVREYHDEVKDVLRVNFTKALIETMYPRFDQAKEREQFDELYANASRIERTVFEAAESTGEYYQLVAGEMYEVETEMKRLNVDAMENPPRNVLGPFMKERAAALDEMRVERVGEDSVTKFEISEEVAEKLLDRSYKRNLKLSDVFEIEVPSPLPVENSSRTNMAKVNRVLSIKAIVQVIHPYLEDETNENDLNELCNYAAEREKCLFETAADYEEYFLFLSREIFGIRQELVRKAPEGIAINTAKEILTKLEWEKYEVNPFVEKVASLKLLAHIPKLDFTPKVDVESVQDNAAILREVENWKSQLHSIRVKTNLLSPLKPSLVRVWHKCVSEEKRLQNTRSIMRVLYRDFDPDMDVSVIEALYIYAATNEQTAFGLCKSIVAYNRTIEKWLNKVKKVLGDEKADKEKLVELKEKAKMFEDSNVGLKNEKKWFQAPVRRAQVQKQAFQEVFVTGSPLNGIGPEPAAPEISRKYHSYVSDQVRLSAIIRLIKTAYPDYDFVHDDRLQYLYDYAVIKEVVAFEKASKIEEYRALMDIEFQSVATEMRERKIFLIGLDKVKDFVSILKAQSNEWEGSNNAHVPIDFHGTRKAERPVANNNHVVLNNGVESLRKNQSSDDFFDVIQEADVWPEPLTPKVSKRWHKKAPKEIRLFWIKLLREAKLKACKTFNSGRLTMEAAYAEEKKEYEEMNDDCDYMRRMEHRIHTAKQTMNKEPIQDWRQSVTRDIRSYFARRLVAAQFEDIDSKPMNRELYTLYRYARSSVDLDFERARTLREFYHRVATKIFRLEQKMNRQNTDRGTLERIEDFCSMMRFGRPDAIENVHEHDYSQFTVDEKFDTEEGYQNVSSPNSKRAVMDGGIASILFDNHYERIMSVDKEIAQILKPLAPEITRIKKWHKTVDEKVRIYIIRRLLKDCFSDLTTTTEYLTYGGFVDVALSREKSIYEEATSEDEYYRMIACRLYGRGEMTARGEMSSYMASINETNAKDINDLVSLLLSNTPVQLSYDSVWDEEDYEHVLQENCELPSIKALTALFRYAPFEKSSKALPSAVSCPWHVEISEYERTKSIYQVVDGFFARPHFNPFVDNDPKIQEIIDYAKKIELNAFEKSNSVSQYISTLRDHFEQVLRCVTRLKKHFSYHHAFVLFTGRRQTLTEAVRNSCLNKILKEYRAPHGCSPLDDERVLKVWVELARFENSVSKLIDGANAENNFSNYLFVIARTIYHIREEIKNYDREIKENDWKDFERLSISIMRGLSKKEEWQDPFVHFPWRRIPSAPIVKTNIRELLAPVMFKMKGFVQAKLVSWDNTATSSGKPMNLSSIERKLYTSMEYSYQNVEEFAFAVWKTMYNASKAVEVSDTKYTLIFELFWWFVDEMTLIMDDMGYRYAPLFNYDSFVTKVLEHPAIQEVVGDLNKDVGRLKDEFEAKEQN